jgi:glutathione peroxidase-family protein
MLHLMTIILFSLSFSKTPQSIYDVQVKDISGKPVAMSQYKGKVLLVVNTASKCGFTPQLKDLQALYKKYHDQGMEVLAFPSNDFKQDPAENSEIASFAQKNYEVTFPFFEKDHVTGDNKQPLYQILTEQKSGIVFKEVQWNFEKFLVGRDGKVIDRWNSKTKPSSDSIVKAVESALQTH